MKGLKGLYRSSGLEVENLWKDSQHLTPDSAVFQIAIRTCSSVLFLFRLFVFWTCSDCLTGELPDDWQESMKLQAAMNAWITGR